MLLRLSLSLITILSVAQTLAQLPWTENFEGGPGSNPWTSISASECNDGSYDYFTITNGSDIGASYAGNSSTYFFATQDMNGAGCGHTGVEEITWDIDISSCTSGSFDFSVLLADDNNGWPSQGWDDNDYVHFYYSIDGGTEQNLLWIESDNSATETQAYIDTDFDNIGDGGLVGDSFSSFTGIISGSGTTLTIRIEFGISEGYVDLAIDDLSVSCSVPANTVGINTVASSSYTVDCSTSTTDAGSVNFTSTGTFNSGNVYSVELSDASGTFSSPTTIGTLTSTSNSGTINFTIPFNMVTGSGYRIRIVSSDPVTSSADNGSNITITQNGVCEPPHLTSVIINSCNASCSEGNNELVFGTTGDYSILVNEANFRFSYSNTGSLVGYTDNLTSNATATQTMNDECSGPNPFIDAYGTTIPPNSSWVLANNAICPTDALDWAGLCNSGPIYVVFSTDASWDLGGNFSNNPTAANPLRPYQTSITTTAGETFTIDYETDGSQYPDNDGVFATFDANGGPATTYGDNDCSFDPLVLPVELVSFKGMSIESSNVLLWKTISEYEASHFTIERTVNGEDWEYVGMLSAAGNSSMEMKYELVDDRYADNINIYRLRQTDYDGTELVFTRYVTIDNRIHEGKNLIGIYNLMGQEIDENYKGIQIYRYSDGTSEKVLRH